jgi:hypothetical protein
MRTRGPAPVLVVDLELAVRRDHAVDHRRSRHLLHGRSVHIVETIGGDERTRTVEVEAWRSELAEVCRVLAPAGDPGDEPSPRDGVLLPWDLVVGTGAALAAGRHDLYAELVGRVDRPVRDEIDRLHRVTVGRLRAVGMMPERRRLGWVAWVLLGDGWRALSPCTAAEPSGVRAMVRLDRRDPAALAHDVARWVAGATR